MRSAFLLLLAFTATTATAQTTADGLYAVERNARTVRTIFGQDIGLGEKFDTKGIRARTVESESNANDLFWIHLETDGAFPKDFGGLALCVAGHCTTFSSGGRDRQGVTMGQDSVPRAAAEAYARFFGVAVQTRQHPGHRLATRFVPSKASFAANEPIQVTLEITNVGTTDVTFREGGQNRAPRDNQFGFSAYLGGVAVQDTGRQGHTGGLSVLRTLKPGQTLKSAVDLRKWFPFASVGTYRVKGTYELELYPPGKDTDFSIWHDYATAEFEVNIR